MTEANFKHLRQETADINVLLGGTIYWVSQKQPRHGGSGVRVICCVQQTQRESRTRSGRDVGLEDVQKHLQNPEELLAPSPRVFPTR